MKTCTVWSKRTVGSLNFDDSQSFSRPKRCGLLLLAGSDSDDLSSCRDLAVITVGLLRYRVRILSQLILPSSLEVPQLATYGHMEDGRTPRSVH